VFEHSPRPVRIQRQTNAYRFGLYLFAVAQLVYVAYILLKLERSNAELRQQAAEQRGLFEIAQLLASTLDRQQVLDRLAEITHSLLGVDVLRIWLRDEEGDSLVLFLQASTMRGDVQQKRGFTPGEEGLVGWVLAEGRPLALSDLGGDTRVRNRAWFEAEGFRSFLGVPLAIQKIPIGVLVCLTRSRRDWSPREVALAEALTLSSAAAIRNARLYEEAQARSSTMRQVAVLSHYISGYTEYRAIAMTRSSVTGRWSGGAPFSRSRSPFTPWDARSGRCSTRATKRWRRESARGRDKAAADCRPASVFR
jgi:K+-sensing histidine kinase KdpD